MIRENVAICGVFFVDFKQFDSIRVNRTVFVQKWTVYGANWTVCQPSWTVNEKSSKNKGNSRRKLNTVTVPYF